MKICLTTACSPWLPFSELIPTLAAAGFDGVEIAYTKKNWDPEQEPNNWNNNAAVLDWEQPLDDQLAEAESIRALCAEHKIEPVCLGSYALSNERDRQNEAFAVAEALGGSKIRARVPWYWEGCVYSDLLAATRDDYEWLESKGKETGIQSLIEVHNNSICATASGTMRVLEGRDPQFVGAIYDPGNFSMEGMENIRMGVDMLGPYLHHVHVKNSGMAMTPETNNQGIRIEGTFGRLADGVVDWSFVISVLRAYGYAGWLSIENFSETERGPARLQDDLQALQHYVTS